MGFPRQEYWGGLPFPSPGDLPYPGIELASPALQVNSLPLSHLESLGASLSPRFYFCTWQLPVFTLECKQHREDHTLKKLVTIVKRLVFRSSIFFPCHVNIYGMIILNMPANLENSAVATGLEKVSFHSTPKKGNAKECSNYHTIALISHASKVMLKILQARLQQYMN